MRDASLFADSRQSGVDQKAVIARVDHILKYQHAVFVAVVVKLLVLDLDMLSEHIKSERFHFLYIVKKSVGRCGGVYAVGVIALIEKSVAEYRLAVKGNVTLAVSSLDSDRAESEIRADLIISVCKSKIIEIRLVGGPIYDVFG